MTSPRTTSSTDRPVPAWRDPSRFTGAWTVAVLGGIASSVLLLVLSHVHVGWR